MTAEQLNILDLRLWPCPSCGDGRETDPETGLERVCRVCHGTRQVDFDPDDTSEFGF